MIRAAGASALVAVTLAGAMAPATASGSVAAPAGRLVFVQGLPQQSLDISLDGTMVDRDSATGAVLGPFTVTPGRHRV
jgi:hypothetical protein